MSPRTVVLLVAGFFGGLGLASCGPTSTCNSATCGGCCDSLGKCQSGTTTDACGTNGLTCGRCGTGTVCAQGECRANPSGGGGGSTGGGGGNTGGGSNTGGGGSTGGGGGGGGCRMIPSAATGDGNLILAEYRTFTSNPGHYNYAQWGFPTGVSEFDSFRLEVVYPNDVGPVPPVTQAFTNVGYFQCSICALFYEQCSPNTLECSKTYLAQSGSVTIDRADRALAGRMTGQASNVRFNEWNLMTDQPVANGGCVQVTSVGPWNVGWNNDGGMVPP